MKYFNALIKPASSSCNLKCKYCFYADEAQNRKIANYGFMSDETAKNLIFKVLNITKKEQMTITFAFQGGEPSIIGIKYFENFINYVNEYNTMGHIIQYSFQTNGILIDEAFCELFKKNDFLVGVSLDGYASLHNQNRDESYKEVLTAIKLLKIYKVRFNILSVVTSQSAKHAKALFSFFKKNKFNFVQTIPCLSSLDKENDESIMLTVREYGEFLKSFFYEYKTAFLNNEYISVRFFDNILLAYRGMPIEQCGAMGNCKLQFVSESNGGIYPCDFYVLDETLLGNINELPIDEISSSKKAVNFLSASYKTESYCKKCHVYDMCKGGCRRYREFYLSEENYCPIEDFIKNSRAGYEEIIKKFMF